MCIFSDGNVAGVERQVRQLDSRLSETIRIKKLTSVALSRGNQDDSDRTSSQCNIYQLVRLTRGEAW